ncbi:MAG: energy transducer TonB [Gammaproteobacteria bacterium]|nr:energy transducer TonB [Gammaproteobacteria bacterium]
MVAARKCWKSDQRGWLFACLFTAAAHAGIFLYVSPDLFASRQAAPVSRIVVSLLTVPAPETRPAPKPVPPAKPPEPVAKKALPRPRKKPVKQPRPVEPEQVSMSTEVTEIPEKLQETVSVLPPPAAGPRVVADLPVEPPRTDAAYLKNPPPVYPRLLLRRGAEGTVIVRAQVQDDGHCSQVMLKESSGFRLLDDAALAAVKDWRFVPARKGSSNVMAWVDVPVAFRIVRK